MLNGDLFRRAFLIHVLLLLLVGRVRVGVTIFLLNLHANVRVFLGVSRDFFILLRVRNHCDYMVRRQDVSIVFQRRFAARRFRLQRVSVDDDGVRYFKQLFLFQVMRYPIRRVEVRHSRSVLNTSGVLAIVQYLCGLRRVFMAVRRVVVRNHCIHSLVPLAFGGRVLLINAF